MSPPASYPPFPEGLPETERRQGRYVVRYARTEAELEAVTRLRYQVFNLELGEGLDSSHATGRDEDAFDRGCHHLIVAEAETDTVIGTYRLRTADMARRDAGFYSDAEFDLSGLPDDVVGQAVELGRACIAREFRNQRVLFLLWRGLADYLVHNRKRYLFGCSSLTSQDPTEGVRVYRHLEREGHVHPSWRTPPRPGFECAVDADDGEGTIHLPTLFRVYLRYGARVCGPPAIDRQFKTIDYLVIFDVARMDPDSYRTFFS